MILEQRLIQFGTDESYIEFFYKKGSIEQRQTSRIYITEKNESVNNDTVIDKYRGIYLQEVENLYI